MPQPAVDPILEVVRGSASVSSKSEALLVCALTLCYPSGFICQGCLNRTSVYYLLTVLEARSPRSKCHQGWHLVRPPFPVCRQLTSHCVSDESEGESTRDYLVSIPLLTRTLVLSD